MSLADRARAIHRNRPTAADRRDLSISLAEDAICAAVDEALAERDERIKSLEERVATLVVVQQPI